MLSSLGPTHTKKWFKQQQQHQGKYRCFGLTEHMPRHTVDQYSEVKDACMNEEWLLTDRKAYFTEAMRLKAAVRISNRIADRI